MTDRGVAAVLLVTAIAAVVILALFVYPGFLSGGTSCSSEATGRGRSYCAEVVSVGLQPHCLPGGYCPSCPNSSVDFRGVEFQLSLGNSNGVYAVGGCITEANSTIYRVELVADLLGPDSLNWTSPDLDVILVWNSPFVTQGNAGGLVANVTCGVAILAPTV